jgi:ankyrin repeat/IBR domain-containing protein 1
MEDAAATCEQAGVHPPSQFLELGKELDGHMSRSHKDYDAVLCAICEVDILPSEPQVPISCGHLFCRQCWESYLNIKIQEGNAHNILCPAQDCTILVPLDTIERVVSKEMARRYLQFDIKAFVESNPNLKWCPYPGCTRVVRRPSSSSSSDAFIGVAAAFIPENDKDACKAVDCGNGHYFCWGCGADAHEPCGCDQWKTWHERITEMRMKTTVSDEVAFSAAANLWIVKNSKPCPNVKCKAPIQKNEGCNHMKCSKCKHEFCWVCREEWKKHNSATGGYFKYAVIILFCWDE